MVAPIIKDYHRDHNVRLTTEHFHVMVRHGFQKDSSTARFDSSLCASIRQQSMHGTWLVTFLRLNAISRLLAPNCDALAERNGSTRHSRSASKRLLDVITPYILFISGIAYTCTDTHVYNIFRDVATGGQLVNRIGCKGSMTVLR